MWGWGPFSPVTTIRASSTPAQMDPPATSYDLTTGGVKISWTAPLNNGNAITGYKIEILSSSSTWNEDLSNCNGLIPSVISSKSCIIPMSTLIVSPHSLSFDALVQVRVSAANIIGYGTVSNTNIAGARIRSIPITMNAPTRGTGTSTT